jgi:hypothetical protein
MVLAACGGGVAALFDLGPLAGVLIFSGGIGILWVVADSLWVQRNEDLYNRERLVRSRISFLVTLAQTDPETRRFAAHEWPELGVEFGDHISWILDDGVNTGIELAVLQAFLRDSTEEHFAEESLYNDDKRLQETFGFSRENVRERWRKASRLLIKWGYLRETSMAGRSTYKWTSTEHFKVMRRRYLNAVPVVELR